jgi:hypothetical protein
MNTDKSYVGSSDLTAESRASAWSLNAYLMAFRDSEGMGFPEGKTGYRSTFPLAKRIVCSDGFSLSVQATHGAYCSPRENLGPWYQVEVGFPSAKPELIADRAEDESNYTETVYSYVDIELVEQLIALHGGPSEATLAAMANAGKDSPADQKDEAK